MTSLSIVEPQKARALRHPASPAVLTPLQRATLTRLRFAAMACRSARRVDLFRACALLDIDGDGDGAPQGFVDTFVRCLPDAIARRPVWFMPGVGTLSFDEAWVMRCLGSIEGGDTDSLNFLLRSRVRSRDRRNVGFLLGGIAQNGLAA